MSGAISHNSGLPAYLNRQDGVAASTHETARSSASPDTSKNVFWASIETLKNVFSWVRALFRTDRSWVAADSPDVSLTRFDSTRDVNDGIDSTGNGRGGCEWNHLVGIHAMSPDAMQTDSRVIRQTEVAATQTPLEWTKADRQSTLLQGEVITVSPDFVTRIELPGPSPEPASAVPSPVMGTAADEVISSTPIPILSPPPSLSARQPSVPPTPLPRCFNKIWVDAAQDPGSLNRTTVGDWAEQAQTNPLDRHSMRSAALVNAMDKQLRAAATDKEAAAKQLMELVEPLVGTTVEPIMRNYQQSGAGYPSIQSAPVPAPRVVRGIA